MSKQNLVLVATLFILFAVGSGCARRVVVYDRPAPPPPKTEIRCASPRRGAVWVPGHWKWKNRRVGYVWVSGHWR